jgi:hypothetical protein
VRSEAGGAGPDTPASAATLISHQYPAPQAFRFENCWEERTVSAFSERRSMSTVVTVMGMPCRRCSVTTVMMANASVSSAVRTAAMRARRLNTCTHLYRIACVTIDRRPD